MGKRRASKAIARARPHRRRMSEGVCLHFSLAWLDKLTAAPASPIAMRRADADKPSSHVRWDREMQQAWNAHRCRGGGGRRHAWQLVAKCFIIGYNSSVAIANPAARARGAAGQRLRHRNSQMRSERLSRGAACSLRGSATPLTPRRRHAVPTQPSQKPPPLSEKAAATVPSTLFKRRAAT